MEVEIDAADSRCQGELTEGKFASVRAELENGAVGVEISSCRPRSEQS